MTTTEIAAFNKAHPDWELDPVNDEYGWGLCYRNRHVATVTTIEQAEAEVAEEEQ